MLTTVAFAGSLQSPASLIIETVLRLFFLLLFIYGSVSLLWGIMKFFRTNSREFRNKAKKMIVKGLVSVFLSVLLSIILEYIAMPVFLMKNKLNLTGNCVVTGCSGQLCLEESAAANTVTDCEWKKEYGCYKNANCAQQSSGNCGWDQTPELLNCLDSSD